MSIGNSDPEWPSVIVSNGGISRSVHRGHRFVEPVDQAAAVGGREGERDDLTGEQRGDELAGAALTPVCEPRAAK